MTARSMLGQPAGWYQDPAPANPSNPETVRFWDGQAWTGNVRLASRKERQAWREAAAVERRRQVAELVQRAQAGDVEAQMILEGPPRGRGGRDSTPDGQLVSGWWRRVGAQVVDDVLVSILGTLMAWPWIREVLDAMNRYVDAAVAAAEAGSPAPGTAQLTRDIAGPLLSVMLVFVVIGFLFEVGFLRGFQATPGKMLVGTEVRLRERPGPLPWGAILLRWLGKRGYAILGIVPLAGLLTGAFYVIDNLWPLGDSKRQAVHDKMAATNVVRRR